MVQPRHAQRLDRGPHALGDRVRALKIRMRQDQRHLLTTVPGRGVDIAGVLAEHARDVLEHDVTLRMPECVVDRLEVVDVEHDQADRVLVSTNLLDLGAQQLLEAPVVGEPRELVGDGLSLHLVMQVDVLERERRLSGQ